MFFWVFECATGVELMALGDDASSGRGVPAWAPRHTAQDRQVSQAGGYHLRHHPGRRRVI